MAEVRLDIRQVQQDGFPPVCAACGEPAAEYRRRWFIWTPGRNVPIALLGTWRYMRVTLEVPFCARDRAYFTRRWVPLFVVGLLALVAGVAAHIATDITQGHERANDLDKILVPAVAAVMLALMVAGWFSKRNSIRVVDVDGDQFTLIGVSDGFVAAVEGVAQEVVPVLQAADRDPPVVTAVDDEPPMVRPVRRTATRRNEAVVQPARGGGWMIVGFVVLALLVVCGGGGVWLAGNLFGGGPVVRLSNAHVVSRLGLLVTVRADYRASKADPTVRHYFVVRSGGKQVTERALQPGELRASGTLEITAAVMPNATGAAFEGVMEKDKPGGGREAVSNVVQFR